MGYCGTCNTHYHCHYTTHDEECAGAESPGPIVQGTEEDFEKQRRDNGWSDEQAEEFWNNEFK